MKYPRDWGILLLGDELNVGEGDLGLGVAELVEGDDDVGVGALTAEVALETDKGPAENADPVAQVEGTVDEGDGLGGIAQHVLQALDLRIGDDGIPTVSCNGGLGRLVDQELIDRWVDMEHVESLLGQDAHKDLGGDDDALGHALRAVLIDMELFLTGHIGFDALTQEAVADDPLHRGTHIDHVPKGPRRYASGRGRVQRGRSQAVIV